MPIRSDIFSLFNNSTISIPRFFDLDFFLEDYDLLVKTNNLAYREDFINIGKCFIKEFARVPRSINFLDYHPSYGIAYTFSEDANRLMMRSTKFSEVMEYCVNSIEYTIRSAISAMRDERELFEFEFEFFKIVGIIFFKYLKKFNFTFQCDDGYTTHIYVNAPHLCPGQKKCYKRTVRNRFNVKV